MNDYGIFMDIASIALALFAIFNLLVLKTIGKITNWSSLVEGSPSFLVKTASKLTVFSMIALTYLTINQSNYIWFLFIDVVIALIAVKLILDFNYLRKVHSMEIPQVMANGAQLTNFRKRPKYKNIIVGKIDDMTKVARIQFNKAQKTDASLTLKKFMSGFGMYDPEALWDRLLLAEISNKLTMLLIFIITSGALVLYLSSIVINVYIKTLSA